MIRTRHTRESSPGHPAALRDSSLPKVALLGRPNVGKSTLFNRLIRSNRAITHDRPGVTRDRMEGIVRSGGEEFLIIDTGGVTLDGHAKVMPGPEGIRGFEEEILAQAGAAVGESALLCLVVDARDGLTPLDRHLAEYLRKSGKPLLLVVNKVDGPERQDILLAEFHSLGFDMLPCSAAHGYNVRGLEDELLARLRREDADDENADGDGGTDSLYAGEDSVLFAGLSRRGKKRLRETLLDEKTGGNAQKLQEGEAGLVKGEAGLVKDEAGLASGRPDQAPEPEIGPEPEKAAPAGEARPPEADSPVPEALPEGDFAGPLLFLGPDGQMHETAAPAGAGAEDSATDEPGAPLRLAMLGRPNAGKSSLVNALIGQRRMIVSDVAGTTRDSVDVSAMLDGDPVVFVDTAGVRRRAKITDTVERYSVNSSLKSTTKAHVTLLVLDASEGLTQQDKRLIDLLHERKTPFMLLVNKSDLIPGKERRDTEREYKEALVFCPHVPLLFVSAKNRHNLLKIVPLARRVRNECSLRVPTGQLNRALDNVLAKHQPPIVRRGRAKFFYLTQAESRPPTFVFFVNDAEKILPSYARYLERSLRSLFGIAHAPMRVHFRSSHRSKSGGKRGSS